MNWRFSDVALQGFVEIAAGPVLDLVPLAALLDEQGYCNGFAGVPGLTPECFFACAISSRTFSLPS